MDTQTTATAGVPTKIDRLLRFSQAKAVVGLSRSKIYELLADADFPKPVKIGGRCYFSDRELQDWIARKLAERTEGYAK